MKKTKVLIVLGIIIIFSILLFDIIFNYGKIQNEIFEAKIKKYGQPILQDGTINNDFFGIKENLKNAFQTTKGINEAIEYASKNNIEYLKLNKGNYLINGITQNNEMAGIIMKSNIHLDLNGSIIKQEVNSSKAYICISIYEVENIKISNGIIIGDKENHVYESGTTSEWGHGLSIVSSKYVTITNLEIYNTIGDCIYISKIYENEPTGQYISHDIVIENCNLHDSRRQGISIIAGENITVQNNEIHNIKGTAPQAGIDLESNNFSEKIEKIYILNNKIYSLGSSRAIKIQRYVTNVEIANNEINGTIYGYDGKDEIYIHDNYIKDGKIIFKYSDDERVHIEKVRIEQNTVINGNLILEEVEKAIIQNNKISNGSIEIISGNAEITNNYIDRNNFIKFAIREANEDRRFSVYMTNNKDETNDEINIINDTDNYSFI